MSRKRLIYETRNTHTHVSSGVVDTKCTFLFLIFVENRHTFIFNLTHVD